MPEKYSVVLTTVSSQQESNILAELLVKEKLAACVQTLPITSTYTWEGEMVKDSEWLLLIKTKSEVYEELESFILANHSYDTPEIMQLPVEKGFPGYLSWIDENIK